MKNLLCLLVCVLVYCSCEEKEPILFTELIYNDEDDVVEERFFGYENSLMLLDFEDKDLENFSTDCSQEPRFLSVRFNYKGHPNLIPLYSKHSDFGQNDDFNIFIHPFQYEISDVDGYLKTKIDLIEQPLLSENDNELKGLNFPVSICADESFHDSSDLAKMAHKYNTINIKLDKTGGLSEAVKIVKEAKK